GRLCRVRAERQYAVRTRIAGEIGLHLVVDLRRVLSGIDHVIAQLHAQRIGIALTTLHRRGVGDVVVDADEVGDACSLGALARTLAGIILRLADMHERAQLLGLFGRSGIDRYDRDALGNRTLDRALQHIEICDGGDDAIRIRGGRLLDYARHVGNVAGRRVPVFNRGLRVFRRILQGVLDDIPPGVRIGRVADKDETLAFGMRDRGVGRYQRQSGNGGRQQFLQTSSHDLLPRDKIGISLPIEEILDYIFHFRSARQADLEVCAMTPLKPAVPFSCRSHLLCAGRENRALCEEGSMMSDAQAVNERPRDFEALRATILERRQSLPKRIAQVAAYALDNPDDIAFGTAASIAAKSGVQPSTLIRFAQLLGFDGFTSMQAVFRARLRERTSSYDERLLALREKAQTTGPRAVFDGFVTAATSSLQDISRSMDDAQLGAAIALLARAETIYVVARRRSYPIASYMAYALGKLGIRTQLVESATGMEHEMIGIATPNDAAIAISFSPYAPATI